MKKVNPKIVGGFVVIAMLLALGAVVVFGGGFFQDKRTFVAFFPGSLSGLRVGAPVNFRGVQIGTVVDVWVEVDPEALKFELPVVMDIELSRIRGDTTASDQSSRINELVEKGLRAQLQSTSFVTGQQSIQLDFHKDTAVNLVESDLPYDQIPTVPSQMEQIEGSIDDVVDRATDVLDRVSDLLSGDNQRNFARTLENAADLTTDLSGTTAELQVSVALVGEILRELKDDLPKLVRTTDETLLSYKLLAESADGILTENRAGIKGAIDDLRRVERNLGQLTATANELLEENKRGINEFTNDGLYEISNLAVDAQAAVEQFRRVMEEMERDPARFFLGGPGNVEVR